MINDTHVYYWNDIWICGELWDNNSGHRVALVEVGSVGADSLRLLSGTRAISTTGWTVLLPPMVKLSICCRSRVATWALAPLFVTKIVVSTALIFNQNGASISKKTHVTVCTTKLRTMEKLRVKNGILLTMNPTEHTGLIIVDAGRLMQAQISAVTMARAVTAFPKRRNTNCNLPSSGLPNMSPVNKFIFLKRTPGSLICANTNSNTTQKVIRMKRPFKTNLNRFSCSIWVNSIGWRKARMRER